MNAKRVNFILDGCNFEWVFFTVRSSQLYCNGRKTEIKAGVKQDSFIYTNRENGEDIEYEFLVCRTMFDGDSFTVTKNSDLVFKINSK